MWPFGRSRLWESMSDVQVHRVFIKASANAIWDAHVDPEWTRQYGYRTAVEYDLRPGGGFRALAGEACVADGEVIEVEPPRRLVQTWRPVVLGEGATQLTFEITEVEDGVCLLMVTHDLSGAPTAASRIAGENSARGSRAEVLSDLKSLLETGSGMYGT
jgi:uncharacterized protein YndB with AHSA1/START domain